MSPPVGIEPGPLVTSELGFLYSHALFILTKSSKSKNQVVHEEKFKDLLSGTCLTGSERRVLGLEPAFVRGQDSIPIGRSILSLDFLFLCNKASDANIGIVV